MNESAATADLETGRSKGWNYRHLVVALVVAAVFQSLLLPCLCQIGTAKMTVAAVFDILMVVRILVARIIGQTDRGWIFYAALMYLSPFWIEMGAQVVIGRH